MNIKSVAKDLLPPVFIKWAKGIHDSNNVRQYDNYSEALADSSVNGYEASDVVKVVICKNKIFADKLHQENVLDLGSLRTMIGVGLCRENSLRVLDFGGEGGIITKSPRWHLVMILTFTGVLLKPRRWLKKQKGNWHRLDFDLHQVWMKQKQFLVK